MKKILLSFTPFWFDKIKSGEKIYEYRRRFCNEPVMAYGYVSRPVMAVTGILILDKRIALSDWYDRFKEIDGMADRINKYMETNSFAMPVLKFIPTTEIPLKQLQNNIDGFKAPQSYYNLAEGSELLSYIENNITILEGAFNNDFTTISFNKICSK